MFLSYLNAPVSQPYRALTKKLGAAHHSPRIAPLIPITKLCTINSDRGWQRLRNVSYCVDLFLLISSQSTDLQPHSLVQNKPQVAWRNLIIA
jgi:hypothetical protein